MFVLTFRRSFPSSLEQGSPHTLIAHLFSYCFHPSRNKVIIGIRVRKGMNTGFNKVEKQKEKPPSLGAHLFCNLHAFWEDLQLSSMQPGFKTHCCTLFSPCPMSLPLWPPQRRGDCRPHQIFTGAGSFQLLWQLKRAFPGVILQLSTGLGANLLELEFLPCCRLPV